MYINSLNQKQISNIYVQILKQKAVSNLELPIFFLVIYYYCIFRVVIIGLNLTLALRYSLYLYYDTNNLIRIIILLSAHKVMF